MQNQGLAVTFRDSFGLVFASEGDLWRVSAQGGAATRLTTHPEVEARPAISPDGRWVAFNASYDGAREVYVIPILGGAPVQFTFEGGGTTVRGWTPDGKVLFTSTNVPGALSRVLRMADVQTRTVETLPLMDANQGVMSDDGSTLFFTRYGLSMRGDNAVLYRGGAMSELWRFDVGGDKEAVRLLEAFDAPIRHPLWWNQRVYFVSDKSGSDNFWSIDQMGNDARQHTRFEGWQLRNPRLHGGDIVYQRGADLYRYRVRDSVETRIDLTLISDRDHGRLRWIKNTPEYLESSRLDAAGESVALTARGRAVVVFPGERRRIELDVPTEARARGAVVGAKGEWVYVILDRNKTSDIWRYPADGRGAPEQLTSGSTAHLWSIHPSRNGRLILFHDKKARLWSLDIETGSRKLIDENAGEDDAYGDFAWSTNGRYVAYTKVNRREISQVVLHDLENGRNTVVSGTKYESSAPAFSDDMAWLYFVSNRNFKPFPYGPWGDRNMGPAFDRRGLLFAVQLDPEARFPFAKPDELAVSPSKKADEVAVDKEADASAEGAEADEEAEDKKTDENAEDPEIIFDGIADRLWQLPVKPGNYRALAASKKFLFVRDRDKEASVLKSITIDSQDPAVEVVAKDVRQFALSADGETLFFRAKTKDKLTLALIPAKAKAPKDLSKHRLKIDGWRLGIHARSEWRQMLLDAWRLHRDFAYDQQLRGVDWDAVLEKYLPFVDRLGHRDELDDVLAQMVAELGVLHSQVRWGDKPKDAESGVAAFLGAEVVPAPGGLEIAVIYDGERDLPEALGPLLKPDVDVRVGDLLKAIDGRLVRDAADLWSSLLDKAGRQVRLDLLRGENMISAIVTPIKRRAVYRLRYHHWVEGKRRKVAASSDGRIGYIHLRAMRGSDIASFARDFYEHFDKDALIIDVRGNSGGNIDSWILSTLLRRVWAFWEEAPLDGLARGNMQQTFRGHLAVIIDPGTYSDGETFAAGVKTLCLGALIGQRTAGAGIWLSNRNRLADRGIARIGQHPQHRLDGRWVVEGRGVSPDVLIINPPYASFGKADAQLDAAIRNLDDRLREIPISGLKAKPLPSLGATGVGAQRLADQNTRNCS